MNDETANKVIRKFNHYAIENTKIKNCVILKKKEEEEAEKEESKKAIKTTLTNHLTCCIHLSTTNC